MHEKKIHDTDMRNIGTIFGIEYSLTHYKTANISQLNLYFEKTNRIFCDSINKLSEHNKIFNNNI